MNLLILIAGAILIGVFAGPLNLELVVIPVLMKKGWSNLEVFAFTGAWATIQVKYYLWYIDYLGKFIFESEREEIAEIVEENDLKAEAKKLLKRIQKIVSSDKVRNHWAIRVQKWAARYYLGKTFLTIISAIPFLLEIALLSAKISRIKRAFWYIAFGNLIKIFVFCFGLWPLLLPYMNSLITAFFIIILIRVLIEIKKSKN